METIIKSSIISVKCELCGFVRNLTEKSYKRNLRENKLKCRNCYNDEEYKKSQSIKSNNFWIGKRKIKIHKSKEQIKNEASIRMRKTWEDPEYRKKITDNINKVSEKLSHNTKRLWQEGKFKPKVFTNELRRKLSEATKRQWEDPEYRKRMTVHLTKISQDAWKKPGYREKIFSKIFKPLGTKSKPEELVESILKDLNIEHKYQYNLGDYNFDFFLPKHNVLIEVQGDYYHNQKEQIIRDRQKSTFINNNFPNLRLKYIWEHETKCKDRIIDNIKNITGIDYPKKVVDLHQIEIKNVDYKEARLFVDKFHYSGTIGNTKFAYGGYIDGQLISLVIFGHLTRNESCINICKRENILELTRFVIHPSYHQENLASYFLSRCVKMLPDKFTDLITFADSTFGHIGTIYKACNWKLISTVKPSYWYIDSEGFVMHKKTLWDHASKMSISELEYANKYGYTKIYGKEKYKFHFKRDL